MRDAITGFAMPITRLEGKWKMSQNRTHMDRKGVVAALTELGSDSARAAAACVASLMAPEDTD